MWVIVRRKIAERTFVVQNRGGGGGLQFGYWSTIEDAIIEMYMYVY